MLNLLQGSLNQFSGMYRRLCTVICQLTDLIRNHCKASSGLSCSGCLNGCIQGQQIRLGCDILNLTDNIADLPGSIVDPLHGIRQTLHFLSAVLRLLLVIHSLLVRTSQCLGILLHDLGYIRDGSLQFLYGTGLVGSTFRKSLGSICHLVCPQRYLSHCRLDLIKCLTELMVQLTDRFQQSLKVSHIGFCKFPSDISPNR